jgi:PAS domain S-box-containing protein
MITGLAGILFFALTILFFNQYQRRKSMVSNITGFATLIADRSSAAVAFNDPEVAKANLSSLKVKVGVENAWIIDSDGNLFASIHDSVPMPSQWKSIQRKKDHLFIPGYLICWEPVLLDKMPIGTVVILRNLIDYRAQMGNFFGFTALIIALTLLFLWWLSFRMQRLITGPLHKLTRTARKIAESRDYQLRAEKITNDEIGELVEEFNVMLGEIEEHVQQRKHQEEALMYERKLLRMVIDNLPDAIYTKDRQFRKTLANIADVRNMNALSEAEVLGKDDFACHPKELAERFLIDDKEVIEHGKSIINREEFVFEHGVKKWLLTSKIPLRDDNGVVIGLLGIGRDITENKNAELKLKEYYDKLEALVEERTSELVKKTEELEKAKNEAESADRLKSAFLATMSHELRTPLNSIIGFTGILKQGRPGPLNDEQHRQLGLVQNSARHLLALINEVLDLSKIEAGQLKLNEETFKIRDLVDQVIELNFTLADQKNLKLNYSVDESLDGIHTDRQRLMQVLVNLVNNAVKFTETGSVSLTAEKSDDKVLFRITDTGIGIEPDKIEILFRPFIQIDSGTTRKHEGTGLGLSICKRLVTMMGGKIGVESEYGKGSTFWIKMPIDREA